MTMVSLFSGLLLLLCGASSNTYQTQSHTLILMRMIAVIPTPSASAIIAIRALVGKPSEVVVGDSVMVVVETMVKLVSLQVWFDVMEDDTSANKGEKQGCDNQLLCYQTMESEDARRAIDHKLLKDLMATRVKEQVSSRPISLAFFLH